MTFVVILKKKVCHTFLFYPNIFALSDLCDHVEMRFFRFYGTSFKLIDQIYPMDNLFYLNVL